MNFVNTKSDSIHESTIQLATARGGNLCNTDYDLQKILRQGAPVIAFIKEKNVSNLPKGIGCNVAGTDSHWLFTLILDAENCHENVPYLFTIEKIRYNRDDTPYIMVKPVTLLSPKLLENERFGDLIVKSGRFPMHLPVKNPSEWDYEPLRGHFNLPADTSVVEVCQHAVAQALAGNISFEEIVEHIHLPESILANLKVSLGGATPAVKSGNTRNLNLLTPTSRNKSKRKRTCKGKKYKEPRQKATSSTNTANNGKAGKSGKNKDNGAKSKKGK